MTTVQIDGYRIIIPQNFDGDLAIHLPQGIDTIRTMDGRVAVSVPAELILKLVADNFVKPGLISRISDLGPREALLGTV